MTNEKTYYAAELVAKRLYEAGCRYAFGMPGGEVLKIVEALEEAGIRFILCKHENNAGYMAEGIVHRDGAPAILVATVGPGALNCINVVANAFQDKVPMIILTGCVDATESLTYTHQVVDHQAVFSPVTKANFRLTAKGADIIADKAVNIALEQRAGPVHIDIPTTVAGQKVTSSKLRRRPTALSVVPSDSSELHDAVTWINQAKRPLLITGLDAVAENAGGVLQNFCETRDIPFITTYKAKGIIREDHPLCLGAAGLSPLADKHLLPFVQLADLIICVGYDPIEMRVGWQEVWDQKQTNVIDISSVSNTHYMHQAGINIVASVKETLAKLAKNTSEKFGNWPENEITHLKEQLKDAFPLNGEWGPAAIIDECQKRLPENTIATADSGAHRILLSQTWNCFEPRGLIQSSAFCTMGCAVPMAMGLQLAEPGRTIISFSGDAGMLMVVGELSTAKELKIAPIFLVFVDASLALIELKQRQIQMANRGVDFEEHDFAAIGEAFGGNGFTVTNRSGLAEALGLAQKSDTFSVIAAVIELKSYDGKI